MRALHTYLLRPQEGIGKVAFSVHTFIRIFRWGITSQRAEAVNERGGRIVRQTRRGWMVDNAEPWFSRVLHVSQIPVRTLLNRSYS